MYQTNEHALRPVNQRKLASGGVSHKSKTRASLLSALLGFLGVHRFFLYGSADLFGWLYLCGSAVYLAVFAAFWWAPSPAMTVAVLFPIPVFVAAIEALVIGLTDDAAWDRRHNPRSLERTQSSWPLALLLVLTVFFTFAVFVACLARATDLLFTGGAFG